ncbi:MAG: S-adenosylmethionine:tRNA ribosyltransferase-isomerase, partial [Taibaiella sp.]|nr:S-adenosylmethionine:tRNA ribosyltransferase-isomerase [Taibaiella sp.]
MHPNQLKIEEFTYPLPDERIAHYPLEQRDASRLLVYKSGAIAEDTYSNIATHIPGGSMMVFNQTKVVHARLQFNKPTGGAIEIFCLEPHETHTDVTTAMLQKGQVWWHCLVGSAKKWKDGISLHHVCAESGFTLSATKVNKVEGYYIIQLDWDNPELTFAEVLHLAGKVPLPPYINRDAEVKDESTYQTIYATDEGSVAAPTAGLHFTPAIMESFHRKNIEALYVTLHVGAGTFMPVKTATMAGHDMHAEWLDVSRQTIQALLSQTESEKTIIAVGTTSLRTIESLYWIGNKLAQGITPQWAGIAVNQWDPYDLPATCTTAGALNAILKYMDGTGTERLITKTQILIAPGYIFRLASALVTNFHQPQSTLLLLVAALVGDKWRGIYDHALREGFR